MQKCKQINKKIGLNALKRGGKPCNIAYIHNMQETIIWGRSCKIRCKKIGESTYMFHIPHEPTRHWVIQRGIWHIDDYSRRLLQNDRNLLTSTLGQPKEHSRLLLLSFGDKSCGIGSW